MVRDRGPATGWDLRLDRWAKRGQPADGVPAGRPGPLGGLLEHRRAEWLGEAEEATAPGMIARSRSVATPWRVVGPTRVAWSRKSGGDQPRRTATCAGGLWASSVR